MSESSIAERKKRNHGKKESIRETCQDEIPVQESPLIESTISGPIREEERAESFLGDNWGKIATFIAISSILAAIACHVLTDNYSGNQAGDKTKFTPTDDLMKELILENISFPKLPEKYDCGVSSYEVYSVCVSELIEEAKSKLEFSKLKNSTILPTDYKRALENAQKKYISHSLAIEGIKLNKEEFKQLKDASIAASKLKLSSLTVGNILDIHKNATYLTEQDEAGKLRQTGLNVEYLKIPSPNEIPSLLKDYVEWLNNEISSGKNELLLAAMAKLIFVQIHPFEKGNERISQVILNYILVNRGYPWVIVPAHEMNKYHDTIKHVNEEGDLTPYFEYILKCIIGSLDLFISDLNLET